MRHQTDVDVGVARILDDVALRVSRADGPVAAIRAKLLRHDQLAIGIKSQNLIHAISRTDGELGGIDGVRHRQFERAAQHFIQLLHLHRQFVERTLMRLRREIVIGLIVGLLRQRHVARDGHGLTGGRGSRTGRQRDRTARRVASAGHGVIRGQDKGCLGAVRRPLADKQMAIGQKIEGNRKCLGAAVTGIRHLGGLTRYGHDFTSQEFRRLLWQVLQMRTGPALTIKR